MIVYVGNVCQDNQVETIDNPGVETPTPANWITERTSTLHFKGGLMQLTRKLKYSMILNNGEQ